VKILVHYPFEEEQFAAFQRIGRELGGHEVACTADDQEAISHAPGCEVILGYFKNMVCAAAPELRWIQSFSAGMDKFLFDEIIARDEVAISNMAGLYAPQGGEHAWGIDPRYCRSRALQQPARMAWRCYRRADRQNAGNNRHGRIWHRNG